MSKRSASDPPQDRPDKRNRSSYNSIVPPGHGQTCPHGCPHHNNDPWTPSLPPQNTILVPIFGGSPAQDSQSHYNERTWNPMQGIPLATPSDPSLYRSRRLPLPMTTWGYQPIPPHSPISIPNLLNPSVNNNNSPSPLPSISPESGRKVTSSAASTPPSKMREKGKESLRQESRGPQQPKAKERSSDSTRRVSFNGIPLRLRNNAKQDVLVEFSDVAAHTAKCDTCNNRNRDGMTRCTSCGWQCCRKCLGERGGNRSHQSFTSTHVPSDERRSLPSTPVPSNPTPAPRLASSGRGMVGSRSMPVAAPGPAPAPAHGARGMVSTAEDREAANALVDISFKSSTRNDRGKGRSDYARAGSDPSAAPDATAEEDQNRAGHSMGQSSLRGELTADEQMEGEEFENPRRNPSRRARPIDLAE